MKVPFHEFGIGLERGTVAIVEHRREWQACFLLVAKELADAVPGLWQDILHIGSTAISSICAKPILDVLGVAPTVERVDEHRTALERAGFEWKGEYGIPGRRFCVAYDETKQVSYVHLHIFGADDPAVRSHRMFRDYLRAHPKDAADYSKLKLQLQQRFPLDRAAYTQGKAALIARILERAARDAAFLRS